MKDEKLIRLSLGVALAGIIALFAITLLTGPDIRAIGSLSEKDAGKHVALNATVIRAATSNGNIFMTLDDGTGNITAVVFERTARGLTLDIKAGRNISITGQINIYKDELEVIVDSVK